GDGDRVAAAGKDDIRTGNSRADRIAQPAIYGRVAAAELNAVVAHDGIDGIVAVAGCDRVVPARIRDADIAVEEVDGRVVAVGKQGDAVIPGGNGIVRAARGDDELEIEIPADGRRQIGAIRRGHHVNGQGRAE